MQNSKLQRSLSQVKKEFSFRKPICPFISSTFQDFQEERDILVKKVFPRIDALCRERGTYCAPIDLRWGINDTQVNQGLVIQLCLDYIQKCSPFFICLLGERYGCSREEDAAPLPRSYKDLPEDADWLDKNFMVAASAGYDWVLKPAYQDCSVTELEILQTAFIGNREFCRFYFRQPDHVDDLFEHDPEHVRAERLKIYEQESEYKNLRVRDLKARIVKKGLPVKYFKTPQELADLVLEDWTMIVEQLYPLFEDMLSTTYTQRFAEWMAHETFAETRRRVFVKTPELNALMHDMDDFAYTSLDEPASPKTDRDAEEAFSFSKLLRGTSQLIEAEYSSIMLLMGDRGCGKTSVLANWVKDFREVCPEVKIFSHYVGSSARSTDVIAFMRRCTLEMREEFPNVGGNENDITAGGEEMMDFHHVVDAFLAALALGPCIVVVDGVDELGETYGHSPQQVKEMNWLPFPLPPRCKMVMTTARSDMSFRNLTSRADCTTLRIPVITNKEVKRDIIEEYLAMHCKSLTGDQIDKIVACKLSERPLFLSILANELRVFGVKNRLDYHLESYLETTSIRELWARIIQRWIKDYSWTLDTALSENNDSEELNGWVADALRLIAVSRHGLTQSEILDMLKQRGYDGEMEVTSLHWALFRSAALDSLFERPGGLIGFFHQHFKEAVEFTLLGSAIPSQIGQKPAVVALTPMQMVEMSPRGRAPDRISFHKYVADYFFWQPHCKRRTDELPWQLERGKDFNKLCEVLAEPKMFMSLCGDKLNHVKRLELLQYWKVLQAGGFSPTDTYWKMLRLAMGERVDMPSNTQDRYDMAIPKLTVSSPRIGGTNLTSQLDIPQILTTCASSDNSTEAEWPGNSAQNIDHILDSLPSSSVMSSRAGSRVSASSSNKRSQQRSVFFSSSSPHSDASPSMSGALQLTEGDSHTVHDSQDAFSDDGLTMESVGLMTGKELSKLANFTGQFMTILGFYSDSEEMLTTAHEKLNANFPLDLDQQQLLSNIQESLGNLYFFQARPEESRPWYNRALDSINELLGYTIDKDEVRNLLETKGRLLDVLGTMKITYNELGESEKMLLSAKRCMEKAGSVTGKAVVQLHIGILRMALGEYAKAESYLRQSLVCLERWYGRSHPRVSEVVHELATLLCDPKNNKGCDTKQAERLYRRALKMREQCFGPDHILVANTLYQLGKLLKLQKSKPIRSQALQYLRRALDIRTTKLGSEHPNTVESRRVLNDLEIVVKLKRTRPLDLRTEDRPYSTLSFHVDQLSLLERKPRTLSAKSRSTIEPPPSRISGYRDSNRDIASSYDGEEEEEEDDYEEETDRSSMMENNSTTNTSEKAGKENRNKGLKTVSYSDQKALLKFSSQTDIKQGSAGPSPSGYPAHTDSNWRPQTVPYRLHVRYGGVGEGDGEGSLSRLTDSRPASAVSTVEHRRKCYIPGPHTIDSSNAYSVVRGPHAHVKTLLGAPEAPRYSAITKGIQHTSAWYHVKGRYSTPTNRYPSKRSQKRITFKLTTDKTGRPVSRGSTVNTVQSCPDYRAITPISGISGLHHGSVRG